VLDRQVAAWNRGDIDGFMAGYWKSEELAFITPLETTHGWQATLDRYKRRYTSSAKMGQLRFEELSVRDVVGDKAGVTGRYHLDTTEGIRTGRFVLTFRRIGGQWVITEDRTTPDN